MTVLPDIPRARALENLMHFLAIEGLSGREGKIAQAVEKRLRAAGVGSDQIRYDKANRRIPGDYEIGNLIVKLPGTFRAPRRLFMGHLDTVPLCRGAEPVVRGGRIESKKNTALGGDNRTAVGALVSMLEALLEHGLPHPPTTLLFTVGEEVGLWGARTVHLRDLSNPKLGFNVDSGDPSQITIGAIGADRWEVDVRGRSSHAGVHPEDGVSASLIASRAIADVAEKGFFGKIVKGKKFGTSNVGELRGGEATNQVTDHVFVRGESRSHDRAFLTRITQTWEKAFERAARSVKNQSGVRGSVEFRTERDYEAFRMDEGSPSILLARTAIDGMGLSPSLRIANGGLDANYLNAKGVPTVTLGAGQHSPHTVDEYVDIAEYVAGCNVLLRVATAQ